MTKRHTFREVIEAAAKPYADLWKSDGALNTTALARYYKQKGHPVTQGTLHRLLNGKHKDVSKETVDATHAVFRVPRYMLRGDAVSAELDKLLTDYKLSTLLLAQRIEALPKDAYQSVVDHIKTIEDLQERLTQSRPPNVTSIERNKR